MAVTPCAWKTCSRVFSPTILVPDTPIHPYTFSPNLRQFRQALPLLLLILSLPRPARRTEIAACYRAGDWLFAQKQPHLCGLFYRVMKLLQPHQRQLALPLPPALDRRQRFCNLLLLLALQHLSRFGVIVLIQTGVAAQLSAEVFFRVHPLVKETPGLSWRRNALCRRPHRAAFAFCHLDAQRDFVLSHLQIDQLLCFLGRQSERCGALKVDHGPPLLSQQSMQHFPAGLSGLIARRDAYCVWIKDRRGSERSFRPGRPRALPLLPHPPPPTTTTTLPLGRLPPDWHVRQFAPVHAHGRRGRAAAHHLLLLIIMFLLLRLRCLCCLLPHLRLHPHRPRLRFRVTAEHGGEAEPVRALPGIERMIHI